MALQLQRILRPVSSRPCNLYIAYSTTRFSDDPIYDVVISGGGMVGTAAAASIGKPYGYDVILKAFLITMTYECSIWLKAHGLFSLESKPKSVKYTFCSLVDLDLKSLCLTARFHRGFIQT